MDTREPSESERTEIEEYLALDEPSLYSLIPAYIQDYDHALFSPEGQVKAGQHEFQKLSGALYQRVCVDWALCKRIDSKAFADQVQLVLAIGDVISAIAGVVPPFLLASLVVKVGARAFCRCSAE